MRLRKFAAFLLVCFLALPAWSAEKPSSKKASTTKTTATATNRTPARKSSTKKSSRKSRTKARKPKVTWRNRQTQPSAERYSEIQRKLIEKGYAQGTPDGNWSPQWADALKRFQRDQNLEASGKLTSLSLIALGLGPRSEAKAGDGASGSVRESPGMQTSRVPQ